LSSPFARFIRALLILGRVSNLPTVWSNCLAGWWLGGKAHAAMLPFLFAGATLLYVGGMFFNDAFDSVFDREFRPERPIPAGHITRSTVWLLGWSWLALGAACLFFIGPQTGVLGFVLLLSIVLYDATHKHIAFAPVLMGACRFVLYLVAASTASRQLTGWAVWWGLAMGAYIIGLSCFARYESTGGLLRFWPVLLLFAPVALALLINDGPYRQNALLLSAVLSLWCLKSMRYTLVAEERDPGRTVSGLLAGIVFVDWLAVADAPREMGVVFLALFALALVFQKFVPAT
jgi:4-hydroxybenzoate polyprenyltransferase